MWTAEDNDGFYVSPHHSHGFLGIRDNQTLFDEGAQTFADADTFPLCEKHNEFGKLRVVTELKSRNYGRGYFVCPRKRRCSFWVWGDEAPLIKPNCHCNVPCAVRTARLGPKKDHLYYRCSQENPCDYFEWLPDTHKYGPYPLKKCAKTIVMPPSKTPCTVEKDNC